MGSIEALSYVKLVGVVVGVVGVAFSGWNVYLQGKIKEISALWSWKDEFEKTYQEDRLSSIEKFATKSEVKDAFDKLDHHLEEIRRSVDRLRDRLENKGD